jgi:5-methylcytosine-specific restriction protein A
MDSPPRNPAWSKDELTIALDLCLHTKGNPTAKDNEASERLSEVRNKMHRLNGVTGRNTLGNRTGMYLNVMNFSSSALLIYDKVRSG